MTDEASRRRHLRLSTKESLIEQIITDDLMIRILADTINELSKFYGNLSEREDAN